MIPRIAERVLSASWGIHLPESLLRDYELKCPMCRVQLGTLKTWRGADCPKCRAKLSYSYDGVFFGLEARAQ